MYQPGRLPPPLLPYPEAPYGAPDPYGMQDPYWAQGPYGPYGPYGNHPTQRPRSFNWLVPVVVLMVFAILVAAGGAYALARYGPATTNPPATAPGTASRTPSIPSGFHAYSNTTIGVQFDVPDGWTIDDNIAESGGTGMQATSPDATALVAAVSFPGKGGNLVGAEDAVFIALSDSKTVDNKAGPTQVTFGGATWEREAGDITHSQLRVHMVVLIVTHGFTTYVLAFLATTSSFTAVDTHVFQRTTQSFRFRS